MDNNDKNLERIQEGTALVKGIGMWAIGYIIMACILGVIGFIIELFQ